MSRGFMFSDRWSHDPKYQQAIAEGKADSDSHDECRLGHCRTTMEQSNHYQDVNLYIKNLDKEFDDQKLYMEFAKFGIITSARVMLDETGTSKGFGFVCYFSPEEAAKAMREMNGCVLAGKQLYVALAQNKEERKAQLSTQMKEQSNHQDVNLYIKNLDEEFDDEKLYNAFAKFGTITSAKVMLDETGTSKGFGFVCFSAPEEAAKAIIKMNGRIIIAKPLYVALAQNKEERKAQLSNQNIQCACTGIHKTAQSNHYQGVNLYIKNLDKEFDDEKLYREFLKFGTITSAKVMLDNTGTSKGFGFVCFSLPEEATRAITEMNGWVIAGKPLYVALAQGKKERKAQLSNQIMQRVSTGIQMTPTQQVSQVFPNYSSFYAPAITPAQRGMYAASQVAHVRNPRWPQPQAHQGGQPVQPVPTAGRHQFAPTIPPAHCGMDTASQVAYMQPTMCPQLQAHPSGQPVQPMPAAGRHQFAPTITPAHCGMVAASQVAHMQPTMCPQLQAPPGGKPVQPMPAAGRHQFAPTIMAINPAQRGMDAASEVAHMQPTMCPQPQAHPGGQPVQPMPAAGRHQFAPTITPTHCGMGATSQVAHMQPTMCPQPKAHPGGQPVQPMPASRRHQFAPTITPTHCGMGATSQVAHSQPTMCPQPKAHPGGQPVQPMPASGRHQFAGNPCADATGATPVRPVQPAPSAQHVVTGIEAQTQQPMQLGTNIPVPSVQPTYVPATAGNTQVSEPEDKAKLKQRSCNVM